MAVEDRIGDAQPPWGEGEIGMNLPRQGLNGWQTSFGPEIYCDSCEVMIRVSRCFVS